VFDYQSFFNFLSTYSPPWALAIFVAVVLSWRTPDIIREVRRRPKGK